MEASNDFTVSLTTFFFLDRLSLFALAMMLSQRCDSLMTFSGDMRRVPRRARAFAAAFRLLRTAARFSGRLAGRASALRGATRIDVVGGGSPLRAPFPAVFPAEARRAFDRSTTSPPPPPFALVSRFNVFFI